MLLLVAELDNLLATNILRYVIAIIAITVNCFLLFLFARYKSLLQSQCNILIAFLAMSDLFIGIGAFVKATHSSYTDYVNMTEFSSLTCSIISGFSIAASATNQIAVLGVAIDRLLAVLSPLTYPKKFNWPFIIIIGVLQALAPAVFIYLLLSGINTEEKVSVCNSGQTSDAIYKTSWSSFRLGSSLLLISVYLLTLFLFYFQLRKSTSTAGYFAVITKSKLSFQQKITLSISLLMLMHTVLYVIPYAVYAFSTLVDSSNNVLSSYATFILGITTGIGACLTFFIYLWKHEELRKYTHKTFSKSVCRRHNKKNPQVAHIISKCQTF
uniref:G-protein coupled receptors family 1 profile domain-containing protein n=1 Tax=Ditylenchus dipsaci TaxID=166011 RepID=A0A915DNZ6_9BILA